MLTKTGCNYSAREKRKRPRSPLKLSKVIAARVKKVLTSIIHYNQTGYVKDRFIGEAIRSMFDIMDLTAKENIPGLLLFIDFQKAFDSVESVGISH